MLENEPYIFILTETPDRSARNLPAFAVAIALLLFHLIQIDSFL